MHIHVHQISIQMRNIEGQKQESHFNKTENKNKQETWHVLHHEHPQKFRSRIQHHHATGLSQHLCVNPITIFDIILSLPDGWKKAGPWGNPCEAAVIYLFPTGSRTITPEEVRSLVLSMVSWPRLHSAGFCVIYDILNGLLNTFIRKSFKIKRTISSASGNNSFTSPRAEWNGVESGFLVFISVVKLIVLVKGEIRVDTSHCAVIDQGLGGNSQPQKTREYPSKETDLVRSTKEIIHEDFLASQGQGTSAIPKIKSQDNVLSDRISFCSM